MVTDLEGYYEVPCKQTRPLIKGASGFTNSTLN